MRDIKFRAWDEEEKVMLKSDDINFVIHPYDGTLYRAGTHRTYGDDWEWSMAEDPTNDLIIMQYTGLKDKNGKEIYEFDWLQDLSNKKVFLCRWVDAGFNILSGDNYIVVGNKYEDEGKFTE